MRRVNNPELLDSDDCPPEEVAKSLRDLSAINRRFGGVSTTRALLARVAAATGKKKFSVLEVAAGFGEVPSLAARQLAPQGIQLEFTLLDVKRSHLQPGDHSVVADALALPFPDNSFDLLTCSLFAHHLQPDEVVRFAGEALRVSRSALLINDLIRHPLHLALVYAAFPLMHSHVSRCDGAVSVRRAYTPNEMRQMIASAFADGSKPRIEISRHFLFRMGVIAWKATIAVEASRCRQ
jgi:ubiquinone/menaquinone biosynthesis C-methylase UbiE